MSDYIIKEKDLLREIKGKMVVRIKKMFLRKVRYWLANKLLRLGFWVIGITDIGVEPKSE